MKHVVKYMKRNYMSIIFSQHFHNKSKVASCYWLLLLGQKSNYWPKMCLLNEKVSTKRFQLKCHNYSYWIYQNVLIDRKCVYLPKMCLLNEKVSIDQKCTYWKMKSHNTSIFLNVYMALIYVVMWRNKKWSTKSQTFRFYMIYKGLTSIFFFFFFFI